MIYDQTCPNIFYYMKNNVLKILGTLVHHLQKERGCASLFSESSGKIFEKETNDQFKKTDDIISEFSESLILWKSNRMISQITTEKLDSYVDNIKAMIRNRDDLKNFRYSATEIINYYTYKTISPLLDIMVKSAVFDKNNDPTNVSAYANLLSWKERTGRERAIGMRGFLSKSFNNKNFQERFQSLIAEQDSFRRTFLALVNSKYKKDIERILEEGSITKVEELHEIIEMDPDSKLLTSMTPEGWYEIMTDKIDTMQRIELSLIDTLSNSLEKISSEKPQDKSREKHSGKTNNSVELSQDDISLISKQNDFIKSLPFFSGISDEKLSEILNNSLVKEYKKGNLLFLEGEQAARLYIVLSGWVKLFKGTIAGDETILQMQSSGSTIGESAVFLNSAHPTSAQIAENAVLLAIPAPIIREQIRNSPELAMNMLMNMSRHSQSLIHHIESTRLKSATDRVGWFLLKLFLDKDYLTDAVELPYDKSMIASYLDMKPETFSRTLKHFKSNDFKIDNNTIILPDIRALCNFCDIDTALSCSRHGTPECDNPQC